MAQSPSPRNPAVMTTTAQIPLATQGGGAHARLLAQAAQAHAPDHGGDKPSLTMPEYMAELNARLRSHSMYLEGMRFPYPQRGSTPMLAAALAWEGPWDYVGVFSSVIEDVANDYNLAVDGSQ
jgi:hypothetical protein